MRDEPVTIRTAAPGDAAALRRLAALDSAPDLDGPVLLAERGGVPVAALSLATGAAIADPFRATADALHLLQLRREQLLRATRGAAPGPGLLRRLVQRASTAA